MDVDISLTFSLTYLLTYLLNPHSISVVDLGMSEITTCNLPGVWVVGGKLLIIIVL